MLEYVAMASFNRANVVMPKPGPEESCLKTSYLLLFILNENNESYVDVLRSKFSDIIAILRELEMAVPALSSSSSEVTAAGTAIVRDKYSKYAPNQSQKSLRSVLTGSTMSTFRNAQPASFAVSTLSSISEENTGDLNSTYNYQMALYKVRKMMKSQLANLAGLLDFVDFLIDSYLPFISLNINDKCDREFKKIDDEQDHCKSGTVPSQRQSVLYEESKEYMLLLKETNFVHFQVRD